MSILNLDAAPEDPIERLLWLSGVKEAVAKEMDMAYAETYFTARREGRFDAAIALGYHGKAKALAYTRKWNDRLGRAVRWGDGIDRYSSYYDPTK